jgi:hypothetical protein
MRMTLRYEQSADRLTGTVESTDSDGLEWVEPRRGLRIAVDPHRSQAVAFTVEGARHFVSYDPISRLFGDEVVRRFAAFQSGAVAGSGDVERVLDVDIPDRHAREAREFLRSHLVG